MLDLAAIKQMHDRAYTANQQTRIKAADDRLFCRVTQWDSSLLNDTQLAYKGEFDIISKARRQTKAELTENQPQIEFAPLDEDKNSADLINGLYLTDDRHNSSLEAYANADDETLDCGLGGWELYSQYESSRSGERKQVIRRRPIYEFNNNAFPDPNAKAIDKSDARYWSILEPYTIDGYKELYKDLTGDETTCHPSNFGNPEVSYVFPWFGQNETVYICRFYHKERVKDRVIKFTDPLGNPVRYRESDLKGRGEDQDVDLREELDAQGFEEVSSQEIERWEVTCYFVSGESILKTVRIPGEIIPVVPQYGERAFIEGEEVWEGIVRRAKDPQRLRNFMLSYVGDIAARGSRDKPLFFPEQVAGFENMYAQNGAENNFAYGLLHRKTAIGGEALPNGPVSMLPATQVPPAVPLLIQATREAVDDVANPGLPRDFADTDMSGKGIELIQARFDNQAITYQEHKKFAKRYDASVYASMASQIYDSPRKVTLTLPNGTQKSAKIMDTVMDEDTGELVTLNDLTNVEFEVYATIGPTYSSKRQKTFKQLGAMIAETEDPQTRQILSLKRLQLMDGVEWEDMRNWASKQLIMMGVQEPETEEEIQFAEEMQSQPEQPDAEMIYAMAEEKKAQASLMSAQAKAQIDQAKSANDQGRLQVDAFRAETDRMAVQVDAQQAGAEINIKDKQLRINAAVAQSKIGGQRVSNIKTLTEPFRARARA
jgi:hypothetical protein